MALACDDEAAPSTVALWPQLSIGRIEPAVALPGTRLRIFANGLVPTLATYEVGFTGDVDGTPVSHGLPATMLSDALIEVPLGGTLTTGASEASTFTGMIALRRTAVDTNLPAAVTQRPVTLALARTLTPSITSFSATDLYLGDELVVMGDGFLLPGEGTSLVQFDGTFTSDEARPVVGLVVPGIAATSASLADVGTPLTRTRLTFAMTPDVFGIRPGTFTGTLSVVNVHADGTTTQSAALDPGPLAVRAPVLSSVTPLAASRGQIITVLGRGLLPSDGLAQTATVLLLEGVFTPRRGVAEAYDGVSAIVIYPDIVAGIATAVLRVTVAEDGRLVGLGANAGRFVGTLTPLVLAGPDAVEGPPLPIDFRVLSPRQVVHIRFLPGFSDALVRFGLLAERAAVERRVLEVLERDYAGFNVSFTYDEPTHFAEFAVVEVGVQDPNGTKLFGLDNTAGKDSGNVRFDDVIGGFNAETRDQNFAAYGGVFASELLNLSPSLDDNDLASPRFDDIFASVVPELGGVPARLGESLVLDDRGQQISEAVRVLGNLLGSTITHEVAHSLGLTAIAGRYHNDGDTPNWIMDAGQFRPFEERAEIDGQGPGVFEPFNRDYLQSILPVDPTEPIVTE